jgi:type VI secretion system protein ImpC
MPKSVQRDEGADMVKALVDACMHGTVVWDKSATKTLRAGHRDSRLPAVHSAGRDYARAEFQKLEGSWRGLHHLVMNTETSKQLKLRVLNISKRELFKDLDKAVEFDQSQLFKKLYEDEFGMPGGEPFGALVGDYEITSHPEDIDLLEKISGVCAAAHCPFISAASPELFGLEGWSELSRPRDLEKIFMSKKYTKWNSFP